MLQAATKLWPDIFSSPLADRQKGKVLEKMRAVRPVVETGYENIVQIRCLLEDIGVDDMLENWHTMLPEYMRKWDLDRGELVDLFGSTRDVWMNEDLDGWLAPNRIYPGVTESLKALIQAQGSEIYIVTTKQARFTKTILQRMAGVDFPMERIFSQTVSGRPKSEVLTDLKDKYAGARYYFVEDKFSTLEKVSRLETLQAWELYLVDWGYNTRQERTKASNNERIKLIDIQGFKDLVGLTVDAAPVQI